MVSLSNAHIVVSKPVMTQLFSETEKIGWVYYPRRCTLLLASFTDEDFKALHKTTTGVLKYKNNKGDRSMDILGILLDNDLDKTDRSLSYSIDPILKILTIQLA